ncbi:DUF4304 domain-containing protein [Amycolatopsis sp. NPDC059090]|uniref:DUF4304 domain-containing protein n=1 Tax=unclassified Amycolatopsis TaxID=2618356 RepID=UPI00366FD4F6
MTAQIALREALRDVVGPAARVHGFSGSGGTWRRSNALGDWAIVNVQSSSCSNRERLRCVINLSLAPRPWLDWQERTLGRLPKPIPESLGLYRGRLHPAGAPPGSDGWWEITGRRDSAVAVRDMAARLADDGWPFLTALLDRERMTEQIRSRDLGFIRGDENAGYLARAEAAMLSEHGRSDELDRLLETVATEPQRENAMEFVRWARERTGTRR